MTSAAVVMPSLASFLRVAGGARGGEMAGAVMRGVYLLTLLCDHGLSAKRGCGGVPLLGLCRRCCEARGLLRFAILPIPPLFGFASGGEAGNKDRVTRPTGCQRSILLKWHSYEGVIFLYKWLSGRKLPHLKA